MPWYTTKLTKTVISVTFLVVVVTSIVGTRGAEIPVISGVIVVGKSWLIAVFLVCF